jgi:hypothetical protein
LTERERGRHRKKRKEVYFTEEELAYVMKKVEQSPMKNFQTFALHTLIQGYVVNVDYKELDQLNLEINRIGNNINQLVKIANTSEEISIDDINNLNESINLVKTMVRKKMSKEIRNVKIDIDFKQLDPSELVKPFIDK